MPIGRVMCGTGIDVWKIPLKVSAKKPVYLNIKRRSISTIIAEAIKTLSLWFIPVSAYVHTHYPVECSAE